MVQISYVKFSHISIDIFENPRRTGSKRLKTVRERYIAACPKHPSQSRTNAFLPKKCVIFHTFFKCENFYMHKQKLPYLNIIQTAYASENNLTPGILHAQPIRIRMLCWMLPSKPLDIVQLANCHACGPWATARLWARLERFFLSY